MNTKDKLRTLHTYYFATRNTGHTQLLKEGIKRFKKDFFVLSDDTRDCLFLEIEPEQTISWKYMEKLKGHQRPIAIDNSAMISLLYDALHEIETLEEENERLREIMSSPMNEIFQKFDDLQKEFRKFRKDKKEEIKTT